jgi:hypothetical protein
VLIKASSIAGDNWWCVDSARNTYNLTDLGLLPNASSQELQNIDYIPLDFTSNGFKIRGGGATSQINRTGSPTYIYAAFAEFPFGGSNVSPSPAR